MATPVELVAVLTPSPGRIDELIETIAPFNDYVKENEPGALRYQLYRQRNLDSGKEDLVYIEIYKDWEALHTHRTSEMYKAVLKKVAATGLLETAPDIKIVAPIAGFAEREASEDRFSESDPGQ